MENNPNSPVFADRYRFEPVGNDWDLGRSGFTGLVYDLKESRFGVIKRTEIFPQQSPPKQSTHSLQNEVKALNALKGLGVPEVYDTNQAEYDSRKYDYAVIEYIEGIRVEKALDSLSVVERAEIITQLFQILSQAHQKGIVNGDVDLKHLFWRKDKKQLVVFDWGNARLDVDPKNKAEFAYDLARAAEVIFSLVTCQGHPSATGSIALPDANALVAGLGTLPVEFQKLCKWAPRMPVEGAQAPYTAKELLEISRGWLNAIRNSKPYKQKTSGFKKYVMVGSPILVIVCFAFLAISVFKVFKTPVASVTPPLTFTEVPSPLLPTNTPVSPESTLQIIQVETSSIPTEVPTFPPSHIYSQIVTFDDQYFPSASKYKLCWTNKTIPPSGLVKPEGFNRKVDVSKWINIDDVRTNKWWVFNTGDTRSNEEAVVADFSTCPTDQPDLGKSIKALALNTWVTQLKPGSGDKPEGEFGLFLKAKNGSIRTYTLWIDENRELHLRIREGTNVIYDEKKAVVHIQNHDNMIYNQFRIQIFLELDNNGSAIIYLLEADSSPVQVQDIDPSQMIAFDAAAAVLPTLGELKEFGLIGRGGSTQVLLWPLVLLGK